VSPCEPSVRVFSDFTGTSDVSATKWVVELEVTRFDQSRAYWTDRGWSEKGPIKLQSRIDVPVKGQGLKAGETVIAGVAWQQQVGVEGVEVQIDEGEWHQAKLAGAISDDTWVQWSYPWTAEKGDHVIRCRATSRHTFPAWYTRMPVNSSGSWRREQAKLRVRTPNGRTEFAKSQRSSSQCYWQFTARMTVSNWRARAARSACLRRDLLEACSHKTTRREDQLLGHTLVLSPIQRRPVFRAPGCFKN
jgi:hypothetical protein